jgi:hypothetical protein
VGSAVAVALALWSTRAAWGASPPSGEDVVAHLVRIDFGIAELVNHGRIDGWFPRFYLGYQEFLFNGPGLVWAVALVRGATFGLLSNDGGLKVVGILSFAAVPPAVAFLARSVGLGRLAAGVAAVLSLLVSNIFGVGLLGLYLVGLVPHQLGAPLFCVALGSLLRIPVDPRARWVVLAGTSLAALALTHLISVMVLVVMFPLLAVPLLRRRPGLGALGRLTLAGGLALGLAGFWLVPLLAHQDLSGLVATWATPPFGERIDDIADGRILFRAHTIWIVLAGWAYSVVRARRHRPFAVVLVIAPIAYLAIAHAAASIWEGNEFTVQLANRGLGYAGLVALLPAAAAVADGARWLAPRLTASPGAKRFAGATGLAVGLGFAVLLVVSPLGPDEGPVGEQPEPVAAIPNAAAQLEHLVPPGARFATEREFPDEVSRTGVLHPEHWLTRGSGRDALNGFNLEATSTPGVVFEPEKVGEVPAEESAERLGRLGVTHVVTTSDKAVTALQASDRFALVWQEPPLAIYELVPADERPAPRSLLSTDRPARAELVRSDPERVRIEVEAERPTRATVAIAWSPKWSATVDGASVDLTSDADGLIEVELPAGTSTLELTYAPDAWDRLGLLITLASVCALAAWGVVHRRRRQRATAGEVRAPRDPAEPELSGPHV